jgi:hypothetical protein
VETKYYEITGINDNRKGAISKRMISKGAVQETAGRIHLPA